METTPSHISPTHHASILAGRAATAADESTWRLSHPPSSWSYSSVTHSLSSQVAPGVSVEIYHPVTADSQTTFPHTNRLPLFFVTHGGGFLRGSPTTEERWLLFPLFSDPSVPRAVIASVSYRLAPEYPFPTPGEDCWAALKWCIGQAVDLGIDIQKIVLAGSSSGAALAAGLSQRIADEKLSDASADEEWIATVVGVMLNVPVLCHPQYFPRELLRERTWSFEQYYDAPLSAQAMRDVWAVYLQDQKLGSDPAASPLLGSMKDLPRHAIFVAGADVCRDEGVAYAEKLRNQGREVKLCVYDVLEHTFGETWDSEVVSGFWTDLRNTFRWLLR